MLKVASELDSALDSALQMQLAALGATAAAADGGPSAAWQVPVTGAGGAGFAPAALPSSRGANTRISKLLAARRPSPAACALHRACRRRCSAACFRAAPAELRALRPPPPRPQAATSEPDLDDDPRPKGAAKGKAAQKAAAAPRSLAASLARFVLTLAVARAPRPAFSPPKPPRGRAPHLS